MYCVLCFCLFTYLFNVCLIIFLFFYICNVWFVLANTRILIFVLNFITMFLPVNMNKFCNYCFELHCKWYFWKEPFKDFPTILIHFRHTWELPVGSSFPEKLQTACLSFWFCSCVGFSQVFCLFIIYCLNGCFLGTALSGCFYIKCIFILILHARKNVCSQIDFW